MAQSFVKNSSSVANYSIDWSDLLGSDTIATSTWSCETGITQDSESETTTVATIWLSGGTAGTTYTCTNTITTAGGATYLDSLYIIVPSDIKYNLFRDLRDELGLTTATDDGQLFRKLEQALAAAEGYCGRKFEAVTATKYYSADAVDETVLYLDDDLVTTPTTVTNGDSSGTTIASTNYWLLPRNGGPPYYAIQLKADCDYSWEFDTDYWVSVEGSWGWASTVPEDVQRAVTRWAGYLYAQKDVPVFETTVFPESGMVTVPTGMPVDVKQLLAPYRKRLG